jgi:hypothetical protein
MASSVIAVSIGVQATDMLTASAPRRLPASSNEVRAREDAGRCEAAGAVAGMRKVRTDLEDLDRVNRCAAKRRFAPAGVTSEERCLRGSF